MRLSALSLLLLAFTAVACSDDPSPTPTHTPDEDVSADVAADAPEDVAADSAEDLPDALEDTPEEVVEDTGPVCPFTADPLDDIPEPPLYTPRWAFEPWISKDISDRDDTYAFVQGFRERDIPVGVVVIDSPWETYYNTFIPNPSRYPDFQGMVDDLHAMDIRIVMWITQMLNSTSADAEPGGDSYVGPAPNFIEARDCGFLVNGGRTGLWWKGLGAGLDFFNPRATTWWHRQQDHVLDMGIDGWKLDFGDSYIRTDPVMTASGPVPHQNYSERYYQDFLAYGVHKRGPEFVTMVRGWDESYDLDGRFYARPEHAPVVWAGDNRRDWIGLIDALDHIFRSALAGYVVVGSDIGGYLDFNDKNPAEPVPANQNTFVRWTAVSAMQPFMQLHGRANLTPWTIPERPDETVAIYRYWSRVHHQLVPFFYSLTIAAYAGGPNIIRPVGAEAEWANDWRFRVGDAFLVAPILDDTNTRDVALPAGDDWYDWWRPDADVLPGGQTLPAYDATDQRVIPLFIRRGAIFPVHADHDEPGWGDAPERLTLIAYPDEDESTFPLRDTDEADTTLRAVHRGGTIELGLSRALRPITARVRTEVAPTSVRSGARDLVLVADAAAAADAEDVAFYDPATRSTWIKVPAGADPVQLTLTLP